LTETPHCRASQPESRFERNKVPLLLRSSVFRAEFEAVERLFVPPASCVMLHSGIARSRTKRSLWLPLQLLDSSTRGQVRLRRIKPFLLLQVCSLRCGFASPDSQQN
jgi:hypothetical protein